jgi:hypothetical protein
VTSTTAPREQEVVGTYTGYAEAQRAVDHLSDQQFPVDHTQIVGLDLRLVERVTRRLTNVRAALAGVGSGAWIGRFIGLLVGCFTTGPAWLGLILAGAPSRAASPTWRRAAAVTSPPPAASSPAAASCGPRAHTPSAPETSSTRSPSHGLEHRRS